MNIKELQDISRGSAMFSQLIDVAGVLTLLASFTAPFGFMILLMFVVYYLANFSVNLTNARIALEEQIRTLQKADK